MIDMLLKAGARTDMKTKEGKTRWNLRGSTAHTSDSEPRSTPPRTRPVQVR